MSAPNVKGPTDEELANSTQPFYRKTGTLLKEVERSALRSRQTARGTRYKLVREAMIQRLVICAPQQHAQVLCLRMIAPMVVAVPVFAEHQHQLHGRRQSLIASMTSCNRLHHSG